MPSGRAAIRDCGAAARASCLRRAEDYFTAGGAGYQDYIGEEATHLRQAGRYLRLARRLGVRGRRVYDIGCAAGFFLAEARRVGWAS